MLEGFTSFAQVGVSLMVGVVVFAAVIHVLRSLMAPPAPRDSRVLEPHR
jgi:hypothetical protein